MSKLNFRVHILILTILSANNKLFSSNNLLPVVLLAATQKLIGQETPSYHTSTIPTMKKAAQNNKCSKNKPKNKPFKSPKKDRFTLRQSFARSKRTH